MKRNTAYGEASKKVVTGGEDGNDYTPAPGRCHAYGCPLPGVYAETNGSMWFCACHDGIRGSDWHTVTTRVRNRIGAFEACLKVMTAPPILSNWVPRAQAFIEQHGLGHLLHGGQGGLSFTRHDGAPVTPGKFFRQLHMALIAECRKDLLSKSELVVGKKSSSGLIDIGELIG